MPYIFIIVIAAMLLIILQIYNMKVFKTDKSTM